MEGRRRAELLAVGGAVVAVLLVAAGGGALRGAAERARAQGPPTPGVLTVACSPSGITVSGHRVAAGPAGVSLTVSSTLPSGSSLGWDAGGEILPVGDQAAWLWSLPPGDVRLTCSTDGRTRTGMSTEVTVVDPQHHWREASLGDAGCIMTGGQPSWKYSSVPGDTAEDAVDALVAEMATDSGRRYDVRDAGLGYPDAATQTWVALDPDAHGFTIQVTRVDTGVVASPDHLCAGPGKPPA